MKNIISSIIFLLISILFYPYIHNIHGANSNFTQEIYEITECNDGIDNDGDGGIDFATDDQCVAWTDMSESILEPQCSDTIDNDSDGSKDYPADPECVSEQDNSESVLENQCNDGVDNDGDGNIDFPADPDCNSIDDLNESTEEFEAPVPQENQTPQPQTPQTIPEIISVATNDFVNGLEEVIFQWTPIGQIVGADSFEDIQELEIGQKTSIIVLIAGSFGIIASSIGFSAYYILRIARTRKFKL